MADPVTLATIGIVSTVAGGATGAFGSIMGGESQSSMYKYQAGVAQINKRIAEQNADYSRKVGEVEAQQFGMKTRAEIGEAKATQGAGGLDVGSGSNLAVRESMGDIGRQNLATIRANAARRAYGYEVEGIQQEAQG